MNNPGIGENDYIDMRANFLDLTEGSQDSVNIQTLINKGVEVIYEPQYSLTSIIPTIKRIG